MMPLLIVNGEVTHTPSDIIIGSKSSLCFDKPAVRCLRNAHYDFQDEMADRKLIQKEIVALAAVVAVIVISMISTYY